MTYKTFDEIIELIDEPNRERCRKLYSDNKELFDTAAGSSHNHQAWRGGYRGHIQDICNIAVELYHTFATKRPLPFSLPDAVLVLFLHDLEKPWKYGQSDIVIPKGHDAQQEFVREKMDEYRITLTPEQENALTYVHGEGHDFSQDRRTQGPLGAFVHICDTTSARIWFAYPKHDGW